MARSDSGIIARKALPESVELIQQALQAGLAFGAHHLAGVCIQARTVVLSVIDNKADVEYILFHRRFFSNRLWSVNISTWMHRSMIVALG